MPNRLYKRVVKVTAILPEQAGSRVTAGVPYTGATIRDNGQLTEFAETRRTNAIEITDARVEFEIEKTLQKNPNTCGISITNLSRVSAAWFQHSDLVVDLQGGYDDDLRHLFTGSVRWARTTHTDTNNITSLQLGDGDKKYQLARVHKSFKANTTVLTALKAVAESMGFAFPIEAANNPEFKTQFANGTVLTGPSRDELSRLLAPYGYSWSIQNDVLQILKDSDVIPNTAWRVAVDTGMIGSPAFAAPSNVRILKSGKRAKAKPPVMTITSLLYPEITPGGTIDVHSKVPGASGLFKVKQVRHRGDTHGSDWITEIEVQQ